MIINTSLMQATLANLEGAYAPNMLKSYYADASAFVDWCNEETIEPFPLTSPAYANTLKQWPRTTATPPSDGDYNV